MAKRPKKSTAANTVELEEAGEVTATAANGEHLAPPAELDAAGAEVVGNGEEAGDEATGDGFEARLAALEAVFRDQLAERDRTIAQQAAELAMAQEAADELGRSRDRVAKLKAKAASAKEAAAEAKKSYEAAAEAHLELEEELLSGQRRLPFPIEPTTSDEANPPASDDTDTDTDTADGQPAELDHTPGRDVSIQILTEDHGLSNATMAKLCEAGIGSIGDLIDWTDRKPLEDIPGIGKVAAERIADAVAAFWTQWAAEQRQSLEQATLEAVEATEAERGEPFEAEADEETEAERFDGEDDVWHEAHPETEGGEA